MAIARVESGSVLEVREIAMTDVPEHKRALWLPVEYEGDGPVHTIHVEADRVRIARESSAVSVPRFISDRQFFQHLAHAGVITADDALAAVGPGTIPAPMLAIIEAMPEAERFDAKMLLSGATQFDRQHPLVAVFGLALGWTTQQLDEFWTGASAL